MKKHLFSISILFFIISIGFAQKSWVGFTSDQPQMPTIILEEQNDQHVILNIDLTGMYVSEVTENDQIFQRLELFPDWTTKDVGKPELPMLSELIGIPDNKMVKVKVLEQETTKLDNYHIYPFQTPTTDNPGGFDHSFVMDEDFYGLSRNYPGRQVQVEGTGIWRDVKITNLHIVPFTYNPVEKDLVVTTHLKVEIEFYGNDPDFTFSRNKHVAPKFYRMYEAAIPNFESLDFTMNFLSNSDIKYLVITNTEALASIQPLVDWKNQQGFRVEVKTMTTGFNTPQEFKDYVSTLYADDNLEYVLMVGDAYPNGGNSGGPNDVPMYWWAPGGEDPSYSDSWYTCLDGPDDHYADLAIGRFVYDNLDELELQVQKTLDHYMAPDASSNWAENTILIAHQEQYPGKYTQCCEEIRTYPYPLQAPIFEAAYGGAGYTNTQVVDYVNANSCGIFNYRGHGSATELWEWCPQGSFTAQHVNQLTNDDRLFVFFDVCCDNMDIVAHAGDCLCESFMKSPVASVAANGAIIPSYTIPNHDYDKEMYKAVFEEGIYNIGYVTNFANITVLNVHGTIGRSNVRTYLWLGDASIEPWTLQPANMSVIHDDQLFLGLTTYSVTVSGTGGPLENAMVCMSNDDQSLYGVAYTDASGYAEIVFDDAVADPGTAKLTVSAHNHLPYQADISVIPQEGPYVIRESYELDDEVGGNNDGMMDYGESILMTLFVKNVGISMASDVTVTLSTSDPYITFTDNTELYGDIEPEEIVSVEAGFAFDVANDMPDGHYAIIDVEANGSGDEIWNSSFTIEGHAPLLELGEVLIQDPTGNGNGKIDPGETVDLVASIENNGSSDAFNVLAELSAADPFLTINSYQFTVGDIGGLSSATGTFNVTASVTTPAGHVVDFTVDLVADLGIAANGTFNAVIGQIPVLILDLDGNGNSSPAMEAALADMDVAYELTSAFPDDLNLYSTLFICLGIYSSNHMLSATEGQDLADYLNSGGNLYMEGGDTWYYDASTAVHPMFNINGTSDGGSDLSTLEGQTGTFTEDMSFAYSGDNSWIDHIEPIAPAYNIFENLSPSYGTGIAYDAGSYKTIGASHEFGGLTDGASPSTKAELMGKYLEFFGMSSTLQALFVADETEICTNEVVEFLDQSSGSAISWLWTFEGGTPSTSTFQNPSVAYFNPGVFDVTLEVSDGNETVSFTLNDYITVLSAPGQAATPAGEENICINNIVEPTPYTTTGAVDADSYIWELSPADAGTISGDGLTALVEWTDMWEGVAAIKVKGVNDCGEGVFSDNIEVVVEICTGIDELNLKNTLSIFPNPTSGKINITFNSKLGALEIGIFNLMNKKVKEEQLEIEKGTSVSLDLSGLNKGVYFIRMNTTGSERIEKLIIQ
ncbi:MAG: T9SS type A sorting domain-containing protein [Bacteroidetes bacterium]|nr:T9SS type A sorting domain-containing protein [Bacteroidota bacterium]